MQSGNNDDAARPVVAFPDVSEARAVEGASAPGVNAAAGGKARVHDILELLRGKNMLVPDSTLPPEVRSEYRRIKRPLLSNAFGRSSSLVDQGNLIMVTSSIPGEGKTYTAVNLALSIAHERDNTVLLVDADVSRQGVSRLLEVEKQRPDLVDLLVNEKLRVDDALIKTDIPNLSLLPACRPHEYITEMVASQRMAELVSEIASRYSNRVIIFDAPPLLSTPESQVLASLVGQVVFVVEAGSTPFTIVQEALGMLPEEKAIGLVLNKSESISNRGSYYYNYYAAYGESDGSKDGKDG